MDAQTAPAAVPLPHAPQPPRIAGTASACCNSRVHALRLRHATWQYNNYTAKNMNGETEDNLSS
eukprot:6177989-Pleurochrysis_carterae.AAC.5